MRLFKKHKKQEPEQTTVPEELPDPGSIVEAGFRPVEGLHYLDVLEILHERLAPAWYLEVGTQRGLSLARARGPSIAVDPAFQITVDAFRSLPELHMFQVGSDAFFANGWMERNGVRLDLAFLDGMHLFEYLLRDVINAERAANAGAMLTLHDCVPINRVMAVRDYDPTVTGQWTGDVWKVLPILRQYRPGLKISVVDCAPTGLVVLTGLDPTDDSLTRNYLAILAEWTGKGLDDYGLARFAEEFPLIPVADFLQSLPQGQSLVEDQDG